MRPVFSLLYAEGGGWFHGLTLQLQPLRPTSVTLRLKKNTGVTDRQRGPYGATPVFDEPDYRVPDEIEHDRRPTHR